MTTAAPRPPPPPPTRAPVPVNPAANVPMTAGQQRGPGMMGQIASTAIGVGIGSAVVSLLEYRSGCALVQKMQFWQMTAVLQML